MTERDRLESLERTVRQLTDQVQRLAREIEELRSRGSGAGQPQRTGPGPVVVAARGTIDAAHPPGASEKVPPRYLRRAPPSVDLETLVGRYGALALAALAILLGVGAFLSWAVARVQLGPGARVVVGALAAFGVAALGEVVRRRGARTFGNLLLGLSLAIAHVVAWGAGPNLHVVSPGVALAGAAVASAALALLAWRENEQALFAVGVGGALLAPFVTSTGEPKLFPLLIFGLLVIGPALFAIRDRPWRIAARVLITGATVYLASSLPAVEPRFAVERAAPAGFALLLASVAIAFTGSANRLRLGRAMLALAVAGILFISHSRPDALFPELVVAAVVVTLSTLMLLQRTPDAPARAAVAVATILTLGALAAGLVALPAAISARGAALAALWTALAVLGARVLGGARREAYLVVLALAGAVGVVLALEPFVPWAPFGLGVWSFGVSVANRRIRSAGLVMGITLVLTGAAAWTLVLLLDRPEYGYPPFATAASAAALAVIVGWWALASIRVMDTGDGESSSFAGPGRGSDESGALRARSILQMLASFSTVGWGYVELARAFSPDTATFLVILYLAVAGVVAILLGRARGLPAARHAGLALAIMAGLKALLQARTLGFGWRLSSYLVVGAFLLGVAYLYRATSDAARGVETVRS